LFIDFLKNNIYNEKKELSMKRTLINTSIVIIANQHNPTILHDSVLRLNEIIDSSFILVNNEQFCTPTLSSIKYENGISFLVDNIRLQIKNESSEIDINEIYIDKIAKNYIQKVPLVKYESIGVNALYFIKEENPEDFIKSKFLKFNFINETVSIDLKFHLKKDDGFLNITLSSGKLGSDNGVIIDFNFHYLIPKGYKNDDIILFINKYSEKELLFENYIDEILKNGYSKG